jgi:hypothetical protein
MWREYQSVKGEDATRRFACRFSVNPAVARGGDQVWRGSGPNASPFGQFLEGGLIVPAFFVVAKFRPPPP